MTVAAPPGLLPWQEGAWARLWPSEHIAHAMLFGGPPGIGKRALAARFAATQLCEQPTPIGPCEQCRSCHLQRTDGHPDRLAVTPAESGKAIGIDQIREILDFVATRPHLASIKLVWIDPADAMTAAAANSLLKVLEEPPRGSRLIVVSDRPATLLATLRSRLVRAPCPVPTPADTRRWLGEEGTAKAREVVLAEYPRAPLLAAQVLQSGQWEQIQAFGQELAALGRDHGDVPQVAARVRGLGSLWVISRLQRALAFRIRAAMEPGLREGQEGLDLGPWFDLLERAAEARRVSGGVDDLLLIEDLLVRWMRLNAKRVHG